QASQRPVGAFRHEPALKRGVQIAAGVPAAILHRVLVERLPFPALLAAREDDASAALLTPDARRPVHLRERILPAAPIAPPDPQDGMDLATRSARRLPGRGSCPGTARPRSPGSAAA